MENSMEVPQKVLSRITIGFSNTTSEHLSKRFEISFPKRCLNAHVNRSTIHDTELMDSTMCPPINEWIKKIVDIHNQILFSL
jgi:hypothetical protein